MSWKITASYTPADEYFQNVSLLLHGNGANGSTTITDNSPSPKTVTANGNAQISTAQSKFGGASIAFDGNGDYLTVPDSNDWDITGNYTVEGWFRTNAVSGVNAVVCIGTMGTAGTAGWLIGHYQGDIYARINSTNYYTASNSLFPVNTWAHFAIVMNGAKFNAYLNGVSVYSGSAATTTTTTALTIGNQPDLDSLRYFNGYIDDLRITKGVARYTANFTPPTLPFPDI